MAIVNATVPVGNGEVQIPFSVQPLGDQPLRGVQPAQSQPVGGGIDFNGVTGLVTAIGGILGAIGFKMYKDKKQEDTRSNLIVDTQLKQVQSLQETDKADYIFRQAVVDYITNPEDETNKQKLMELAQDSKQNYKAYYENIQPQPSDYDKDPVVRKISAVQKRVEPSNTITTDD